MEEEKATPYPLWTEDICDIVCEPTTDYGRSIVYQGTTITNALKDYYTFSTNREKVSVLKWIVTQPAFTELTRLSLAENKIYTLYTNQYDEILKTGEIPNNLQIAQKFLANKFDVYLLANPRTTKSADFIIKQRNILYYVEGKTSNGGSAFAERLQEGAKQADRIAINFIGNSINKTFSREIKNAFENNENLKYVYVFKGAKLIFIKRNEALSKTFSHKFIKLWTVKK